MIDIVLSFVFAAPLLVIMIYPSMKLADFISNRWHINQALDDKLTVIITIILSLIGGIALSYF
jgi:hypothetical protein